MNNGIRLGIVMALGALAWTVNALIVAFASTWLISNNKALFYIIMILDYPVLFFITGLLLAVAIRIVRDIWKE